MPAPTSMFSVIDHAYLSCIFIFLTSVNGMVTARGCPNESGCAMIKVIVLSVLAVVNPFNMVPSLKTILVFHLGFEGKGKVSTLAAKADEVITDNMIVSVFLLKIQFIFLTFFSPYAGFRNKKI